MNNNRIGKPVDQFVSEGNKEAARRVLEVAYNRFIEAWDQAAKAGVEAVLAVEVLDDGHTKLNMEFPDDTQA